MQQTTEPSVAPIPPGASKRADQSNPRWPYRLFGCLWLLGTIAVQFWLGWNLSQIGHSLDGPAFAVAGVGLGLGLLGSATFWAVGKLRVSSFESVAVPLAIGAVALAMAGAIWVEPDIGFGVLIAGALVLVVFAMLAAHKIRALATVVVVVALAAGVALLPSASSLRFKTQDEGRLNALVTRAGQCKFASAVAVPVFGQVICSDDFGYAAFEASQQYQGGDYAYLYEPGMTIDNTVARVGEHCLVHLDGSWWELGPGGGGIECPGGFTYVPGP